MPYKPRRLCRIATCPGLTSSPSGYCEAHAHLAQPPRMPDRRGSAASRGYGTEWRAIRAEVLVAHRIHRSEWGKYDIDHNPPYDPAVEPDHRKYTLIPRLHADHSRKTARDNGGWGNRART